MAAVMLPKVSAVAIMRESGSIAEAS